MIRAGALGYVTKTIDTEELVGGDRAGGGGRRVFQPPAGGVRAAGLQHPGPAEADEEPDGA